MTGAFLEAGAALPASPAAATATAAPEAATETAALEGEERGFTVTAEAYWTFVPHQRDYLQPTVYLDAAWLHLEARYNYEDLRTFSAWAGYDLRFGDDEASLAVTPMAGAAFGDTAGGLFGCRTTLSFWRMEVFGECEYLVDARDRDGNFFYAWSEVTFSPLEWLRFGVAIQRTKAYETDIDIHRGPVVGVTYGRFDLSCCVFDLGWDDPTVMVGLIFTY